MVTVGSSLAVALLVPDQAEKIYAVVGATAVCCVCYVVPVYIQLCMYQRHQQELKAAQVGDSSMNLCAAEQVQQLYQATADMHSCSTQLCAVKYLHLIKLLMP